MADVRPRVLALFKRGSADGLACATMPLQLSGSRNLNPKPPKTKPRKTWRGPVFRVLADARPRLWPRVWARVWVPDGSGFCSNKTGAIQQ